MECLIQIIGRVQVREGTGADAGTGVSFTQKSFPVREGRPWHRWSREIVGRSVQGPGWMGSEQPGIEDEF